MTLDALRGVAAVAVLVFHVGRWLDVVALPRAYLAVDFFFLLSGFVISEAYDRRLVSGGLTPSEFILRRLVRLWPFIGIGVVLTVVVEAINGHVVGPWAIRPLHVLGSGLLAFFLIPTPRSAGSLFLIDPPLWSIMFEIVANVFYAMIARHLNTRVLIFLVVLFGAFFTKSVLDHGSADVGWDWETAWAGLPRTGASFFGGVALSRLWRSRPKTSDPGAIAVALALAVVLSLNWADGIWDIFVVSFVFPIILLAGSALVPAETTRGASSLLGTMSYGLYAIHIPIIVAVRLALSKANLGAGEFWIALVISLAAASGLALALTRYVDEPVRRFLSARVIPRGRAQAA